MQQLEFNTGERRIVMPVERLLEHCYLQPGDSVIVAGSLVEGIGNPYSDIDVYVLTHARRRSSEIALDRHHRVIDVDRAIVRPGEPDRDVYLIHTIVPGTTSKVDVEFKTYADLDELVQEVDGIFRYASEHLMLLTKKLAVRNQMFLNRLFNSVVLRGGAEVARIQEQVGFERYCYLCYRWVASDFSVLIDIVGALKKREFLRAIDLARENLISQTMAVLHLGGVVNTNRKWVISYLDKSDLPQPLKSRFAELYGFIGTASDADKQNYVERSLDFVDELHAIGSELLGKNRLVPSGAEALRLLEETRDASTEEELSRWEYDYRARAYGAVSAPTKTLLAGAKL